MNTDKKTDGFDLCSSVFIRGYFFLPPRKFDRARIFPFHAFPLFGYTLSTLHLPSKEAIR